MLPTQKSKLSNENSLSRGRYVGVMGGCCYVGYGTHGCRFIHPSIIAHFVCLDFLILVLDLFCNNRWGLRES